MTDYLVISRERRISATPATISAKIVDFHEWVHWSPWEDIDPNLARSYSGEPSGVGAAYHWSGNRKAGAGEMVITSVKADEILLDLTFEKPFKSASKTEFRFQSAGDQTLVTWTVKNPKSFGMRVMGMFMNFEKLVGDDLERGLAQLAAVTETSDA